MSRLGDGPIEQKHRELMNALAEGVDEALNGNARGKDRKVGFVLLVFPFDGHERQAPIKGKAQTYRSLWRIITHPAFRLGFLDAQAGKPPNHDEIARRILDETPPRALERLGWHEDRLFESDAIEKAQYRYEEGRLCVADLGLRCRAWGHPDYPPASIRDYIAKRAAGEAPALDSAAPLSREAAE